MKQALCNCLVIGRVLQNDVVAAAFHNAGGGNDRQASFLLQLLNGEGTAVAPVSYTHLDVYKRQAIQF